MLSPIIRLTTGFVNNVNEAVIGDAVAPSPTGLSRFAGQLGKEFELTADVVRYDPTIGTIFAGRFRYVRLSLDSTVPAIGVPLFWVEAAQADPSLYEVTTELDSFTYASAQFAGVNLTPNLTLGNYTVIQTRGLVYGQYVASITGTKASGRPVSVSQASDAFDIIDVPVAGLWVGQAVDLPVDNGLKIIDIQIVSGRV